MKLPLLRCLLLAAVIVGTATAAPRPTPTPERLLEMEELPPGFFRLDEWIPPPLRDGLSAYEEGRTFACLGAVQELLADGEPAYAVDDAQFLRALALVAVGWDDLAVSAFTAVLDAKEVGPYYVPSLLALVEVHDRGERWKAIADAWQRWVAGPLAKGGERGKRVNELLWEFGELRPAELDSTRRENKLLSAPEELAVILEKRRERASDRLFYRVGQALLRVGRHEKSLAVLLGVGIESPYYPYARYSIAQNQFALEQGDEAWRTLVRLGRYPKLTQEEKLLGSRAKVMQAAIRFEAGETEKGIRIARAIDEDDPEAARARLLLSNALLDAGDPALALAYGREQIPALAEAEARLALTIGAAYVALGDKDSAAKVFRTAAGKLREARGTAEDVRRLRGLAEEAATERQASERAARKHVSDAMRIVLAHDGPWNLGTLLRRIRAALGAGPHRLLARGTKLVAVEKAVSSEDPWVAYLASARRPVIELALDRLADVEAKGSDAEHAFRVLNAYLLYLEQAPSDEPEKKAVARRAVAYVGALRAESKVDLPPLRLARSGSVALEAASYRRRLAGSARAAAATRARIAGSAAARDDAGRVLGGWVDGELENLLRERGEKLRTIEFDLEVALSGTLVGEQPAGPAKTK